MANDTLDDLELELRRLPGVRAAGFEERDDLLLVQIHVASTRRDPGLPAQATRVVARNSDRPVAVEVIRWRDPVHASARAADLPALGEVEASETSELGTDEIVLTEDAPPPYEAVDTTAEAPAPHEEIGTTDELVSRRARLLAVLSFPDTQEVEVHLVLGGRRTIGRAPVGGGLPAVVDATIDALDGLGSPVSPTTLWARPIDGAGEGSFLVGVALQSDDLVSYGLACGSSPLEAAARSTLDALNRRLAAVL